MFIWVFFPLWFKVHSYAKEGVKKAARYHFFYFWFFYVLRTGWFCRKEKWKKTGKCYFKHSIVLWTNLDGECIIQKFWHAICEKNKPWQLAEQKRYILWTRTFSKKQFMQIPSTILAMTKTEHNFNITLYWDRLWHAKCDIFAFLFVYEISLKCHLQTSFSFLDKCAKKLDKNMLVKET